MTSLAPANAKFKKDFHESSPAKRSMSRKQKRKKTSHTTFREGLTPLDGMNGRPKTSYLLQNVAERMPWPKQSRGREPIDPMTPVKAFTIENEHVSPFRESYKDFRSSLDKLPEEPEFEITGLQKEDDYKTKYDMDKELRDDFINSETIVLDNKPLSSTQNKINENNANSSPIKLSKKNTSIHDIITLLQNQPNDTGQYFYLVPKKENVDKKQANKQKSLRQSIADLEDEKEEGGPYDLIVMLELEDTKILSDYNQFYTISKKGITTYVNEEPVEFITLNDWLQDQTNYNKIRKKTFFQKFDRWKVLRMWRRKICIQKREKVTEILQDKLFILHDVFSKVILNQRKRCIDVENQRFLHLPDNHTAIKREDFVKDQIKIRDNLSEKLQKFSRESKSDFMQGISDIIKNLQNKITKDSDNEDTAKNNFAQEENDQKKAYEISMNKDQPNAMKTSDADRVYENLGFKPNLKYGGKSNLRKECSRFLRFSYLLDFVTMDALRNIYLNSVQFLVDKLNLLTHIKIDFEFDASKSQFGESKRPILSGPEPLFILDGDFKDDPIRPGDMVEIKIRKFNPPPVGNSTSADFDPIAHLEIEEKKEYTPEEEVDILDESDEESKYKTKLICPNIHKLWIKLDPTKTNFIELLDESINQGYASLKVIERWSRSEELDKYAKVLESWDYKVCDEWEPPDDNHLDCDSWLESEELRVDQKKIIHEFMDDAFDKADKYITNFKPYLQIYYDNMHINYDIILHEKLKNPQEVIPELLKRLNQQIDDFDNYLPESKDLGLLRIDFKKCKQKIKPSPKEVFDKVKKEFPLVIKRRIMSKKNWLLDRIDSITSAVIDVDQFVKQVQALEFIDKHFQDVKDEIDLYQNLQRICAQNGIPISKEDSKLISEIYQIISNLSQSVMDTADSIDHKKKNNIDNIRKKIPMFQKDVQKFREKLQNPRYLDIKNSVDTTLDDMSLLKRECDELVAISKKYQEWQVTLDMEVNQFVDVDEVRREVNDRISLWSAIKDWQDKVNSWINAPFDSIDTETISLEADKYTKTVIRCERGLPDGNSAVMHLKKKVFEFKDTMPIVNALGNKELQPDHWIEIKNQVPGIDFELEKKEFSLGQLIDINISEYQEVIQNISIKASQEASLRRQLDNIKAIWESLEFSTKMYKDNVYILTELDEIQMQLDDSLTNINNVMGNRYIAKHKKEGAELKASLDLFVEIFDQWKECQRNWLYLENIFLSEDIKQQTKTDYNEFEKVNKRIMDVMKNVTKDNRVKSYAKKNLLKELDQNNKSMEEIQRNLEAFLEKKRQDFPRFFFLSNDELLQILAAAQDIHKVEKHLSKIFENIVKLKLGEDMNSNQIYSFISGENEIVKFISNIKIRTEENVEYTLKEIESRMYETLRRKFSVIYNDYDYVGVDRKEWVLSEIGQVITSISQIIWTEITENFINDMEMSRGLALNEWLDTLIEQLKEITELIRGKLDPVKRRILISLITADVHNRDIVKTLDEEKVDNVEDFEWQKQLKYYMEEDQCVVRQVNSTLKYGYEYMGAASRLVITPLTDRCWITITGALNIKLGAAPAGPAGTGKTESTKDLAKSLGVYCVVFNCSEQINYKMMGRLFSGLVSQGAWACLDEFNRIGEEVLSVIAQQLLTIRFALLRGDNKFEFMDSEMTLKPMCGVFVTMNPGYEGRTELPDNLAVLFRPVAMMIPNYGLIAEIMLFAEGFEDASSLSTKMVQLYKLASEQLSQQKHYDFGMRAVKSVLVMAGALKRENPKLQEDVVLIRAMRDSNIPKFLAQDLPLFKALIQDLFPKVSIPEVDYGELQAQIIESCKTYKLEPKDEFVLKTIQLFDIINVRFGAMIVGPTGGGKTTCYTLLSHSMTNLRLAKKSLDQRFQEVHVSTLNPKSITMGELYGQENPDTKEWTDGLASKILRENAKDESQTRRWCIFDGPVDAVWIENMNSVLDDSQTLCLANGERIKLRAEMRILFETKDLAVASPATVSRCGMVYMTSEDLGWVPYVNSWMKRMFSEREDGTKSCLNPEAQVFLRELFDSYVDDSLDKLDKLAEFEPMQTHHIQKIT